MAPAGFDAGRLPRALRAQGELLHSPAGPVWSWDLWRSGSEGVRATSSGEVPGRTRQAAGALLAFVSPYQNGLLPTAIAHEAAAAQPRGTCLVLGPWLELARRCPGPQVVATSSGEMPFKAQLVLSWLSCDGSPYENVPRPSPKRLLLHSPCLVLST